MKEEDNIKNTKLNALKSAARMNQRAKLFAKLVANLPNEMVASEDPPTPLILQVLLSISTYMKKRMVAAAIVRKWGGSIWVMGRDKCVL